MAGSGGTIAVAGAAGLTGAGGGLAPKAWDDFVVSAEGWTISGDDVNKVPTHSATDGHPNGQINVSDGSDGVFFFTAPSRYLGNLSAYYEGVLRFDIKIGAITTALPYDDVQLTGAGLTIAYDCTPDPKTSWSTYTVPLHETGWKVNSIDGAAATATQFKQVLASLARLRIRGEYNNGSDTAYLDNVYLGPK